MRIEIVKDNCLSTGYCFCEAPGTFALGPDGFVTLVDPTGDAEEAIRRAAASCPTHAIRIVDDEPGGGGSAG